MSTEPEGFSTIEDAVAAIGRGEIVVVVDDEDRENEGDLIMAAEAATPENLAFFVRHTSGVICAPLTGDRLDELDIPLMVSQNTESHRTAFTQSVDFRGNRHGLQAGLDQFTELPNLELVVHEFLIGLVDLFLAQTSVVTPGRSRHLVVKITMLPTVRIGIE